MTFPRTKHMINSTVFLLVSRLRHTRGRTSAHSKQFVSVAPLYTPLRNALLPYCSFVYTLMSPCSVPLWYIWPALSRGHTRVRLKPMACPSIRHVCASPSCIQSGNFSPHSQTKPSRSALAYKPAVLGWPEPSRSARCSNVAQQLVLLLNKLRARAGVRPYASDHKVWSVRYCERCRTLAHMLANPRHMCR